MVGHTTSNWETDYKGRNRGSLNGILTHGNLQLVIGGKDGLVQRLSLVVSSNHGISDGRRTCVWLVMCINREARVAQIVSFK